MGKTRKNLDNTFQSLEEELAEAIKMSTQFTDKYLDKETSIKTRSTIDTFLEP